MTTAQTASAATPPPAHLRGCGEKRIYAIGHDTAQAI